MKIYTSYFYQIRFFPPNLIPLSTAAWPPKWYGTPETQSKDKRGVINGLSIPPFIPGYACHDLCHGNCNPRHPADCSFLRVYYKQLLKLNYNKIMASFEKLAAAIKEKEGYDDVDFALIVFEPPDKPCSERVMIHKWFEAHDNPIEEWYP